MGWKLPHDLDKSASPRIADLDANFDAIEVKVDELEERLLKMGESIRELVERSTAMAEEMRMLGGKIHHG